MLRTTLRLGVAGMFAVSLMVCAAAAAQAQAPPKAPAGEEPTGVLLTCVVTCSETKLQTSNAWIRWTRTSSAANAAKLEDTPLERYQLETTVFKDGFDKGLFVALPVVKGGAPIARPNILADRDRLRAYHLQVVAVERSGPAESRKAGVPETSVMVEGLEPGMNYTWRLSIQADGGEVVSRDVTCQAPVCPADMQPEEPR